MQQDDTRIKKTYFKDVVLALSVVVWAVRIAESSEKG